MKNQGIRIVRSGIRWRVLPTVACACAVVWAGDTLHVTRTGRSIQQDGLLIEWRAVQARSFGRDTAWLWDAQSTRDGLAGYFRISGAADSCLPCTVTVEDMIGGSRAARAAIRAFESDHPFFSVFHPPAHDQDDLSVEWIVPWSKTARTPAGEYRLRISTADACGRSIAPLVIVGSYGHGGSLVSIVFEKVRLQLVIIVVLLVLFLGMQWRIRNRRTRRRE